MIKIASYCCGFITALQAMPWLLKVLYWSLLFIGFELLFHLCILLKINILYHHSIGLTYTSPQYGHETTIPRWPRYKVYFKVFFCFWNAVDLHGLLPKSALTANDVPIRVVTNRILYPLPHGYSNSFLMTDLIWYKI